MPKYITPFRSRRNNVTLMDSEPLMRQSFSSRNPFLQIAWDSTSLGELKTCPRKYYYNLILGKVARADNVHLIFGVAYHHAQQAFHYAIAEGATEHVATISAVRTALKDTIGWKSDDHHKNRYNLIRTIIWHIDQFGADDPATTIKLANGKPAAELSWRFDLGINTQTTGEPITLCGHLDRVVMFHNKPWILDYKTTKQSITDKFFDRYSPDNQISTYSYAGKIVYNIEVEGIIVDAAQILVNGTRFQRGFAHRSPEQIYEWRSELDWWLQLAEYCATKEHWPQNDKACFMYGGCVYREICGKHPAERPLWLDVAFENRLWDPLQVRGEL